MLKKSVKYFVLSGAILLSIASVHAQMFAPESSEKTSQSPSVSSNSASSSGWGKFYQVPNGEAKSLQSGSEKADEVKGETLKAPAKQEVENPEDYKYKNIPQVDRPTFDGVKRGRTSVIPVTPNSKIKAEGYIYLLYSDFSIGSMMNGSTTCDVKFEILTTLDRRLNSLGIRLKWQNMDTPLTFIDVNPNQRYYTMYTLLGEGCYSMDKIPNIVVNRCRVKGMTQEECARRVRWIRKM